MSIKIDDLNEIKKKFLEKEKNKIQIKIAMSVCAKSSGSEKIFDYFMKETKDKELNVEIISTGCMGFCYCEPTLKIVYPKSEEIKIIGDVTLEKAKIILEQLTKKEKIESELKPRVKEKRVSLLNCGNINPESFENAVAYGAYFSLENLLHNFTKEDVVNSVEKSGLRGRGGAGYSTGKKWRALYERESDEKYIICNADEGDPGAFMDRAILAGDPHLVLEGMIIGGYAVGAKSGIIYIRAEYPQAIEVLLRAIEDLKKYGLLGESILGTDFSFNIELKYGAGAFVCGEETALIQSMEGKRGEPKAKPPYPVEVGYRGKPTVVNNVETFANITRIFQNGVDWYRKIGTEKSPGTKVFALVGKVKKVGLVEVPLGTKLKDIIYEIGGGIKNEKSFKAVQTGGPSGGCLSSEDLEISVEYDELVKKGAMMGSGGLIVLDEDDCMVEMARFYIGFSVGESCGKCTPCRIGTKRLYEILDKVLKGGGEKKDLDLLEELSITVRRSALCGLGKAAPNPVLSTLKKFRNEYLNKIERR
ncbi:NADH-ubiquinone oxidoreductase-F iron-sulfur binding region domain-containing protein [Candidatus Cetobacterium colombiensis]|uniref:NADH-ubiquinone oxidoreductase-F iron-sulfur binding region domain-containing protein n=1 Tax=Candidatus Cetobacterium colombiensis TaxID=3073100 RepID=A0ABU4W8U0_9FUSO|nr:NADH-ubiquinone oxidoreductase-F iron-sulfur binding region domain-containing protein [Candidatus Cetobacterium colombiensis]MDX8335644.1 NADH-ubiquinone oxidoreductase-F iron-sulfur binding region domain-containing protein [Candidatus Cetobacterium colombiensis]